MPGGDFTELVDMSGGGAFYFDIRLARRHIWLNGTESAGISVGFSPNISPSDMLTNMLVKLCGT